MNETHLQARPIDLWTCGPDGLQECRVQDRFQIPGADAEDQVDREQRRDLPTIVALSEQSPAVAMLLFPATFGPLPRVNGVPRQPGVYLLDFGDRIDFDGRSYWVSVSRTVERTQYDPGRHGEDVFCAFTKKRLEPGDEIVVCPGRPEQSCGLISLSMAWDAAVESTEGFRCYSCGFDPQAAQWRPVPLTETRDRMRELLEKAESKAAQFAAQAVARSSQESHQ